MVTVETTSIVFTGLSVSLAAFYYINTLRNAQRTRELALIAQEQALETRQAQLFMQIYDHSFEVEFLRRRHEIIYQWKWEDFDDYMKKYSPFADPELSSMYGSISQYFEGIGVLLKRGLIDATLIDDLLAGSITQFWEKFGPMIYEARKHLSWPSMSEWTEYLYNQIKPIAEEQHPELKT